MSKIERSNCHDGHCVLRENKLRLLGQNRMHAQFWSKTLTNSVLLDFTYSRLEHSKPEHSKLEHSRLEHSRLEHSRLEHSRLEHSRLTHSRLEHSQPASPNRNELLK